MGRKAAPSDMYRPTDATCVAVGIGVAAACTAEAAAQVPGEQTQVPETQLPAAPPGPAQASGLERWLDPATAPFIAIPDITTDPNSGTTVGIIPTWLATDEDHDIRRIIAPDVIHNPYFGYGMHARIYAYPSSDEQWSITAGVKQRVERSFIAQFQDGRLRNSRWSISTVLLYETLRPGPPGGKSCDVPSPDGAKPV
jgi:hypothetical protein